MIWRWLGSHILLEFKDILQQGRFEESQALFRIIELQKVVVKTVIVRQRFRHSVKYSKLMRILMRDFYVGSDFRTDPSNAFADLRAYFTSSQSPNDCVVYFRSFSS
jgi:hypothetical protein